MQVPRRREAQRQLAIPAERMMATKSALQFSISNAIELVGRSFQSRDSSKNIQMHS
jgi:hypothetical protein